MAAGLPLMFAQSELIFFSLCVNIGSIVLISINSSFLGIKDFLITSDGEVFDNPKYLRKSQSKLKYIQRIMSFTIDSP